MPTEAPRVVSAAKWIALCTLLSRVTGLVRDMLLAQAFGLGRMQDAWKYAFQFPNLFRRLFGEGGLAPVFVPTFARLLDQEGRPAARALLAQALALLTTTLLALLALLWLGLAAAWWMLRSDPVAANTWALPLGLTALMAPFLVTICVLALLSAVLNCVSSFIVPASAPILLNLCLIGGLLGSALLPSAMPETTRPDANPSAATTAESAADQMSGLKATDGAGSAASWLNWPANADPSERRDIQRLTLLGLTVLVAGGLQLLFVWPALRRQQLMPGWHWAPGQPAVREMLQRMPPVALSQGILAFGVFLDTQLCMLLTAPVSGAAGWSLGPLTIPQPLQPGALSALSNAQTLYQFPLGVLVISLATAALPEFSRLAGRGDWAGWAAQVRQTTRLAIFEGLLAGTMMIMLAEPIVRLLLEYGRFGAADTLRTAGVLRWYGVGLWAFCAQHMLQRAYYSVGDARTPVRISLFVLPANLILTLALAPLAGVGEAAFAIASAATFASAVVAALALMPRRAAGRRILNARDVVAIMAMVAIGGLTATALHFAAPIWPANRLVAVFGPLIAGTGLFLLLARLVGLEEAETLLALLRRRPRRA